MWQTAVKAGTPSHGLLRKCQPRLAHLPMGYTANGSQGWHTFPCCYLNFQRNKQARDQDLEELMTEGDGLSNRSAGQS